MEGDFAAVDGGFTVAEAGFATTEGRLTFGTVGSSDWMGRMSGMDN